MSREARKTSPWWSHAVQRKIAELAELVSREKYKADGPAPELTFSEIEAIGQEIRRQTAASVDENRSGAVPKKPLAGKNAIVTGASRGIGAAIAVALAEAGANVAINYRGSQEAANLVAGRCRKYGVRARLAQADVGVQSEVERIVEQTAAEFGKLDIVISNAAYSDRELFYEANMSGFERTVQVTMWGAFYLLRAATRQMIKSNTQGSVVIVSSPHSWRPIPGAMAYNMSKAAIDQMARTAATELCGKRIRVNTIHPGWIDTPGERKFFSEEKLETLGAELPWGRLGQPHEIARGVVFLCDPASDYVTGSSLLIDGGIELPVQEMHRLESSEDEVILPCSPDPDPCGLRVSTAHEGAETQDDKAA